jgi:hypothetical protein
MYEFSVHGRYYTAYTLAIKLAAVVHARVPTYKHFRGSYLHIEIAGPGSATAFKTLFLVGCSVRRPDERAIFPFCMLFRIFSYLLAKIQFCPTLNDTRYLERDLQGVCEFIYFCNVRNVKEMWLCQVTVILFRLLSIF